MKLTSISLNGDIKPVVQPDSFEELQEAWRLLGLTQQRPAIVIVGGAGGMSDEDVANVQLFFEKHLIPFARQRKAAIIEGGTNSGVMGAIGRARNLTGNAFPLVGVVARGIEKVETLLEPHHSHFILCPGSQWGDESKWIAAAASALSGSKHSAAIVINGGKITWDDARLNIDSGRQVLIAEGSGRTADVIATTSLGQSFDRQAIALLRTGKVHVANFFKDPKNFIERLDGLMQ